MGIFLHLNFLDKLNSKPIITYFYKSFLITIIYKKNTIVFINHIITIHQIYILYNKGLNNMPNLIFKIIKGSGLIY